MRAWMLAAIISLPVYAQETADPAPQRIIITPPSEAPVDPDTTFMAMPDGRIVSLADWSRAILNSTGSGIPTDPLAIDVQNGRIARLSLGIEIEPENDGRTYPHLMMAQLGPRLEGIGLDTFYASIGRSRDGSPLGPLWCDQSVNALCVASPDGRTSDLVKAGTLPSIGGAPLSPALFLGNLLKKVGPGAIVRAQEPAPD